MRSYIFHCISEVEIVDGSSRTIIRVKDDRLDELRPFSKLISQKQWEVGELHAVREKRRSDTEYAKLQGMLEIYVKIMMQGEAEVRTWRVKEEAAK